jgi:hypothetical protein
MQPVHAGLDVCFRTRGDGQQPPVGQGVPSGGSCPARRVLAGQTQQQRPEPPQPLNPRAALFRPNKFKKRVDNLKFPIAFFNNCEQTVTTLSQPWTRSCCARSFSLSPSWSRPSQARSAVTHWPPNGSSTPKKIPASPASMQLRRSRNSADCLMQMQPFLQAELTCAPSFQSCIAVASVTKCPPPAATLRSDGEGRQCGGRIEGRWWASASRVYCWTWSVDATAGSA